MEEKKADSRVESEPLDSEEKEPEPDVPDCLLINCSDLLALFEDLGFCCDESLLEEQALS